MFTGSVATGKKVMAKAAERSHQRMSRAQIDQLTTDMLRMVGFPDPKRALRTYPFELSGGLRQRAMIAMALVCRPALLIADEPTTALDVTIQAQILELMLQLQTDLGMAMVLITHDLGVVAEMAERVAVMYAGQIVEEATTVELFREPLHPYTSGLMGSVPVIGRRKTELAVIPGRVPNLIDLPPGCRVAPRCQARRGHGLTRCTEDMPALVEVAGGHKVRCFLHSDEAQVDVPVQLTKKDLKKR